MRPDLALRYARRQDVIAIGLDEIAKYLPEAPVILEAGALNGEDTVRFARRWPDATIHALEPLPEAYSTVVRNTQDYPRIHTYRLALGDHVHTAQMYVDADPERSDEVGNGSSSLLRPTGHLDFFPEVVFSGTTEVEVTTLDSWATMAGVNQLDFVWLDLQGMELRVLKAAPQMIDRIGVICLEVSRRELYAGAALYDETLEWMLAQGFKVAIDRVPVIFGNMMFVRDHLC